jgi:hypothetical protein
MVSNGMPKLANYLHEDGRVRIEGGKSSSEVSLGGYSVGEVLSHGVEQYLVKGASVGQKEDILPIGYI